MPMATSITSSCLWCRRQSRVLPVVKLVHIPKTRTLRRLNCQKSSNCEDPSLMDAPARKIVEECQQPGIPASSNRVKRKVALHLAYVGTGYQGLQFSKEDHVKTIEAELLRAIHKSGIITDANSTDLKKLKWSRSSRTDKGVHSLSTVIALKVMVDESQYDSDPEGIKLADEIAKHLDSQLTVFSVQRVNKHFRARQYCTQRSYKYYLPASLLTNGEVSAGGKEEQAALESFRKALSLYVGRHAFHNFTKMKNYKDHPLDLYRVPEKFTGQRPRKDKDVARVEKKSKRNKRTLDEESSDSEVDELGEISDEKNVASTSSKPASESDSAKGRIPEEPPSPAPPPGGLMYGGMTESEKKTGRFRYWNFEFKDLEDSERDGDVLVRAHYRDINSFTVSEPELTGPDGVRAVCCEVKGASFMLHQIRYMIAAAVAASRGFLSFSVLEATLDPPIRINLPLAPPFPLMLADCEFQPFPLQGKDPATVSKWSGDRLMLQSAGKKRQEEFKKNVLMPAVGELLKRPEWELWSSNLHLFLYQEGISEVDSVLAQHRPWAARLAEKKEQKRKMLEEKGIDNTTYWKQRKEEWRKHGKETKKSITRDEIKDKNGDLENKTFGIGGFFQWLGRLLPKSKATS